MKGSWQTWRSFAWSERLVFLQALLLLPLADLALRVDRYQSIYEKLRKRTPLKGDLPQTPQLLAAQRYAQLVAAASRRNPFESTCLRRSLVLWWLLRRKGIDSALCLGVRKRADNLEAHAWVEVAGKVVNDSQEVVETYERIM